MDFLHSLFSPFVRGAHVVSGKGFLTTDNYGSVIGDENILKNTYRLSENHQRIFEKRGISRSAIAESKLNRSIFTQSSGMNFQKGTSGLLNPKGIMPYLPSAMAVLSIAPQIFEGDFVGAAESTLQSIVASHYGEIASKNFSTIIDPNKAKIITPENVDATGKTLLESRTFARSKILGSLVPNMTAFAGAAAGYEIGHSLGTSLGSSFAGDVGGSVGGFVGSIFGVVGGAKLGAFAGRSIFNLAGVAAGIGAGTLVAKGAFSVLESGFAKERRSRGLNFASDTSAFMTNAAVTMRQRALQAMHKSNLNARSAFGQEATITHMNRDMFSQYKRL